MRNISKKNAFRAMIRKNYLSQIFTEKRNQIDLRLSRQQNSDSVHQPASDSEFINFTNHYLQLLEELPKTIHQVVEQINNNPEQTRTLLFDNIQKLTSTFSQTNLIEWSNYLYLIQNLLVFQTDHSPQRVALVKETSGPVLHRINKLCQGNKMREISILRNYYDYLLAVHHDLLFLDSIELAMIIDNMRRVLVQICTPQTMKGSQDGEKEDLLNSVILLCNNIISLNPIQIPRKQDGASSMEKEYECEHIRVMFLSELFKNSIIIKNLMDFAIDPVMPLCESILRFFVNYTSVITELTHLRKIEHTLLFVIQCLLADNKNCSYEIQILVLRLINNIIVSGPQFCSNLVNQTVLSQMARIYGSIYGQSETTKELKQYEIGIERQFVSTLASSVIIAQQQPEIVEYLKNRCNALGIILQTLKIMGDDADEIIKCLEVIVIYINHNHQLGGHVEKYVNVIKNIWEEGKDEKVCGISEQILNFLDNSHKGVGLDDQQFI